MVFPSINKVMFYSQSQAKNAKEDTISKEYDSFLEFISFKNGNKKIDRITNKNAKKNNIINRSKTGSFIKLFKSKYIKYFFQFFFISLFVLAIIIFIYIFTKRKKYFKNNIDKKGDIIEDIVPIYLFILYL